MSAGQPETQQGGGASSLSSDSPTDGTKPKEPEPQDEPRAATDAATDRGANEVDAKEMAESGTGEPTSDRYHSALYQDEVAASKSLAAAGVDITDELLVAEEKQIEDKQAEAPSYASRASWKMESTSGEMALWSREDAERWVAVVAGEQAALAVSGTDGFGLDGKQLVQCQQEMLEMILRSVDDPAGTASRIVAARSQLHASTRGAGAQPNVEHRLSASPGERAAASVPTTPDAAEATTAPSTAAAAAAIASSISSARVQPVGEAGGVGDSDCLCPEHPEDLFSRVSVDPTLSGHTAGMISLVKKVYLRIAYEKKAEYFTGNPRFATRGLNFLEPQYNVENIIVGECQSGKSAEIAWAAWCSFFILGCLPVVTLRNSGGRVQGKADMKAAIATMNARVQRVADELAGVAVANMQLNVVDKWIQGAASRDSIMEPTVLLALNNAAAMKKMLRPHSKTGAKKIYPCKLIEEQEGRWLVQYRHDSTRELRTVEQLRSPRRIVPGLECKSEMSEELRTQPGLLKQMEEFGDKNGKRRVIFIIDEADLTISDPARNSGAMSKLNFQEQEAAEDGDDESNNASDDDQAVSRILRGAREYAFGSINVTATPQALFLCTFQTDTVCVICNNEVDRHSRNPRYRKGGRFVTGCEHDSFHFECLKEWLPSGCSICADDDSLVPSWAGLDDIEEYEPRIHSRNLKPHLVFADRADNYIAHESDGGWPENGLRVKRVNTPLRDQRISTKTAVYHQYWTEPISKTDGQGRTATAPRFCTEEDWEQTKRTVLATGKQFDLGYKFIMAASTSTTIKVVAPTKKFREEVPIAEEIFNIVEQTLNKEKENGRGQDAASLDANGIQEMIKDMTADTASEYRHGLIITDKTKNHASQAGLRNWLVDDAFSSEKLAVATYNCKDGVNVRFTEAAINDARESGKNLISLARKQTQDNIVDFQEKHQTPTGAHADIGVDVSEDGTLTIKQPIAFLYDGLKGLCSRIIVVTGEMGGRGVAYHSQSHDRILTDMFCNYDLPETRQISVHSESIIQMLGRCNTIEVFGSSCPTVRLWAPPPMHRFHKISMDSVIRDCKLVQQHKDYHKALKDTPQYWVGTRSKDGDHFHLQNARSKFKKQTRAMRGDTELDANLGPRQKVPRLQFGAAAGGASDIAHGDSELQHWGRLVDACYVKEGEKFEYKWALQQGGFAWDTYTALQISWHRSEAGLEECWTEAMFDYDDSEGRKKAVRTEPRFYNIQWKRHGGAQHSDRLNQALIDALTPTGIVSLLLDMHQTAIRTRSGHVDPAKRSKVGLAIDEVLRKSSTATCDDEVLQAVSAIGEAYGTQRKVHSSAMAIDFE